MLTPHLVRRYQLLLFLIIEILLIYLLYLLKVTPGSSGYEPSIYARYPATFWLIYFVIYLVSSSALVYSIFVKHDRLFTYVSLFNLVVISLILLLLPFFRAYFSIGLGDGTDHLASIKEMASTHHFGGVEGTRDDPYPIAHILSVTIFLITQIKLETVGQITPVLYYAAYILFIYLLGGELYRNNRKSLLLLLFALVPILEGYYYGTALLFVYLIPLLIYVFIMSTKRNPTAFRCLIVIVLVVLPFVHPASSLFLAIAFAIVYFISHVLHNGKLVLKTYHVAPLLFVVVWLFWVVSLEGYLGAALRMYIGWFSNAFEQTSYYKDNLAGLQVAQLSLVDAVFLYIKKYGPVHGLFGLALVFSLYTIIYNLIKKKIDKLNVALSSLCLIYVTLYIIGFFFTLTLLGGRVEPYAVLISTMVVASFLFNLVGAFTSRIKRAVSLMVIIILLFSTTYIATFSFYDSPFVKNAPGHLTYMELDSMDWFLQNHDRDLPVEDLNMHHLEVARYLLGYKKARVEPGINSVFSSQDIPPHFNYGNEPLFARTLKKDAYLINNKKNELISVNVYAGYEKRWTFQPDDYKKLESDTSLDKIYHNGEIKIFYVNGDKWSKAD